jgi:hypothetical protein
LHSGDRPYQGGGIGSAQPCGIPWSAVKLWCDHHAMTRDEMALLDACIQAMDETFMAWWKSTTEAAAAAAQHGARR